MHFIEVTVTLITDKHVEIITRSMVEGHGHVFQGCKLFKY